ncbi:MAG TPA: aldo/keto reductase [Umezawaea sp.]|nr:aldo/keto reductase [Umezawaea sp.]
MAIEAPGGTVEFGGRAVARIGFGAMQLTEAAVERRVAVDVLRRAVELGVNHVDTAGFYGAGACNALIREALFPYPEELVLVSKVGAEHAGRAGLVPAQRPEQLRSGVEADLASLGVERVDVVNLRRLDAPPGLLAEGDQLVDLDSQVAELVALREEGKIGGIGLSNVDADQVRRVLPAGVVCVQNGYNVLDRSHESTLEACREHGIAWVPFFPLGSAFSGLPRVTESPEVGAVAGSLGVTPAQVGLAWLLARYPRTLLIPGTADRAHLEQNVAAGSVRLDADVLDVLDRVA